MSNPGDALLTFGRHRGQRLADVPSPYLAWVVELPEADPASKAAADEVLKGRGYDRLAPVETMPMGQYKGVKLQNIPGGYFSWLLRQEWLRPGLRLSVEREVA